MVGLIPRNIKMKNEYKTSTGVPLTLIQGSKKSLKEKVFGKSKKQKIIKFDLPEGTKIIEDFSFSIPGVFYIKVIKEIMDHEKVPTKHQYIQWFGGVYTSLTVSRY